MATYKAYAATEAGAKLTLIDVPIPELGADDVAIDVTHCGICHSDLSLIDGEWGPFSAFPEQVSGHEAVGVITAVGANVTELAIGGIVGVGWQKGSCMMCAYCLKDEGECCTGPTGMIPTCAGGNKGGFAQKLNCHWKYAIPLPGPDVIPSEYLGPLMCGGITAYKPLVDFSKPGDRVGVVGLGGIGCMGVQLAKARDCHVTVFSRSEAKRAQAMEIGADAYIAMSDADQVAAAASSIDMILYTPNQCPDLMPYISCLAMKGKMAFIGAILAPPALPLFGPPIMKDLVFAGSHIGGPKLLKELVDLVVSKNVRIPVHVHPFEEIDQCLDKMRAVDHNGRFVLKW